VNVWDANSREKKWQRKGPYIGGTIAFSPDGSRLAGNGNSLQLWDAATGAVLAATPADGFAPDGVSWSPDRKEFAIMRAGSPRLLDARDAYLLLRPGHAEGPPDSRNYQTFPLGDGRRLLSRASNAIKVWETATGRWLNTLVYQRIHGTSVLTPSPAGDQLA